MSDPTFQQHQGRGYDGTPLCYWTRRAGPRWLIVCTGYGGTLPAWEPLFHALDSDWSILIWDYRGQFGSPAPPGPITIEDHSRDLDGLLQAEGIYQGVLMAWSVGVQVALEHYRRCPGTALALVLINGAFERCLHAPLGDLGAPVVRGLTRVMVGPASRIQPFVRPFLGLSVLAHALRAIGLVRGDPKDFSRALGSWKTLDLGRYLMMTLWADDHVTSDMHEEIAVPTLITYGTDDIITPPRIAQQLHQRVPASELLEIPGTTHYSIIEKPAFVADQIDQFLTRNLGRA